MKISQNSGFTLIEVMIVTSIIGLLAIIATVSILNAHQFALDVVKKNHIAAVEKAKAVLTMPPSTDVPGSMGLSDPEADLTTGEAVEHLLLALNINSLDVLNVKDEQIQIGNLATKAFYAQQ